MMVRRTEEGAVKCALRDFLREEEMPARSGSISISVSRSYSIRPAISHPASPSFFPASSSFYLQAPPNLPQFEK
jgi:hypothetical protein